MNRMPKRAALATAAAMLAMLAGCAQMAPDAGAVLRQADAAMGGTQLKSVRVVAAGTGASFGQAYQPGQAWPRLNASYTRLMDYENGAMREDFARSRAEPNGGGGVPLMGAGEQRGTGLLRGSHAWNMAGPAPSAAPVTLDGRIHDLWTSPHGVIKAAMKNSATARGEGGKTLVSFSEPGRFRATAVIGADGLVERVDSVQPSPVIGDTVTVTHYSEYRDVGGGVKFPGRVRQEMGGFPVLDARITEVQVNVPSGIEVPPLVAAFAERVAVEKAAEGVWFLAGGSHNSVAIEMADHIMLVEAPLYDGRALAVLAEARKLVPGKPVRYVVNSHHHFDHAGGLRAMASEGVTLVTSEQARPFFEQAMGNPNTAAPDALARSGRKATVTGVSGQRNFADALRTVEVHFIEDSPHAQGFMMVWLPRERLLVQADAYTPGPPGSPASNPPNLNNVVLAQNIDRLRLNVDRILPLHGRIVALADLHNAIGRRP
ncbi:MAG TPA: MBL fold metallo-hydrolase [Ramlibacter sp.]|nr:MBL fold metallo-hydrolase [Ramlibacter sp.]